MKTMQAISNQVQWYEGMLLSPQHFQQNNLYFEQVINHKVALVQPYYWGVTELTIDPNAIQRNEVIIKSVAGILPDGTPVSFGQPVKENEYKPSDNRLDPANNYSLSLKLHELTDIKDNSELLIYLGVPTRSDACASDAETERKRYDSVNVGKIIDINDMNNEVDLVRLRPRLHLLAGKQYDENKYSAIPILRIKNNGKQDYCTLPFTPPIFTLPKSALPHNVSLGVKLESLLEKIYTKAKGVRDFFVQTKDPNSIVSEQQKRRIHYLMAYYPALEMLLKSETAHPFDLYKTVVNMAGHMSVLHESMMPPPMQTYEHNNIDESFQYLFDFIEQIVEKVDLNFKSIPFAKIDDIYQANISNIPRSKKLQLVCKIAQGSTIEMLEKWVQTASIGSKEYWEKTIKLVRISGAERTIVKEFSDLKISANDDEIFVEVNVDPDSENNLVKENDLLFIAGADQSLAQHAPSLINWFVPVSQ